MLVRFMELEDRIVIATLFQEMQAYYGGNCPPTVEVLRDLQDLPAGCEILVAADPGVIGLAAVSTIYPGPGLNAGLFIKELFVSADFRRHGVGRALMRATAEFAMQKGMSRLDWTADRNDERLLAFYRATGAVEQREKVFFRLSGEKLEEFAQASMGQ